jgi:hypothetical protein
MTNPETPIVQRIMLAASKAGHRLWRNNVGMAWTGKSQRIDTTRTMTVPAGAVIVYDARPLHAGLAEGSGDLIGFTMVSVVDLATEMSKFGRVDVPVFTSVEVKTAKGKVAEAQTAWADALRSMGCIAGVARSPEEYTRLIGDD